MLAKVITKVGQRIGCGAMAAKMPLQGLLVPKGGPDNPELCFLSLLYSTIQWPARQPASCTVCRWYHVPLAPCAVGTVCRWYRAPLAPCTVGTVHQRWLSGCCSGSAASLASIPLLISPAYTLTSLLTSLMRILGRVIGIRKRGVFERPRLPSARIWRGLTAWVKGKVP